MASVLRPSVQVQGSRASSFAGLTRCFQRLSVSPVNTSRSLSLKVVDIKHCQLTGKKRNRANAVTFSNKKSRKWQQANLQIQRVFWEREKRWIRLRISTKALRTLQKKGLESMAKEQGLDLYSLPYTDARPERTEWLASRDCSLAPMSKTKSPTGSRKMKNPEKLEASKKKPLVAKYDFGRLYYTRAE